MSGFNCKKFRRLLSDREDRVLQHPEEAFLAAHRTQCEECEWFEKQGSLALNMLRMATLDPEPSPAFEDRILRRVKLQTGRESFRYWSPAFVGACIAGLAVVAALQMITRSSELPQIKVPGGEAIRIELPRPSLDLNISPSHRR